MLIRAAAAQVITRVAHQGKSLTEALNEPSSQFKDHRDQALLQAICFGVCRHYFRLTYWLMQLLDKPLKAKDQDIQALLLVGLYQLAEMRIPDYAAVTETVAATQSLGKEWAKNLVNAVLRGYQRRAAVLSNSLHENPEAQYAHPAWFIGKIKKAWPNAWELILQANLVHPPFSLRVNQQQITRENYLNELSAQAMQAAIIPETDAGIVLEKACEVEALPGFLAGQVSVQDGAAQLAATLLQLSPGMRVLDACAAPGGKTAHMLESQPWLDVVAIDQDETRLDSVKATLRRLRLNATCLANDAKATHQWWDGKPFDRILLDAPCSASGVIRRHPDILLLRQPEDIAGLAEEQSRLLSALWPTLKEGGLLLYATCSIFPQENHKVITAFLTAHPDAQEEKITTSWGVSCHVGKQILPGMHGMDGFYYACLRKCTV